MAEAAATRAAPTAAAAAPHGTLARTTCPPLRVTRPGDAMETEANRLADTAMRPQHPTAGEARPLRGLPSRGAPAGEPNVSPAVHTALDRSRDEGEAMDTGSQAFFAGRFGRDLGGVRVHRDSGAAAAARDLRTPAFAHGRHLFFGAGAYRPDTPAGRHLIAHEVAHAVRGHAGVLARFQGDLTAPDLTGDVPRAGDEVAGQLEADPSDASGAVRAKLDRSDPIARRRAAASTRSLGNPRAEATLAQSGDKREMAAPPPAPAGSQPGRPRPSPPSPQGMMPAPVPAPARPPPPSAPAAPSVAARSGASPRDERARMSAGIGARAQSLHSDRAAGAAEIASAQADSTDAAALPAEGGGTAPQLRPLADMVQPAARPPAAAAPRPAVNGLSGNLAGADDATSLVADAADADPAARSAGAFGRGPATEGLVPFGQPGSPGTADGQAATDTDAADGEPGADQEADIEAVTSRIEQSGDQAIQRITGQGAMAKAAVNTRAAAARSGVQAAANRAVSGIHQAFMEQGSRVDAMIVAAHAQIDVQTGVRQTEVIARSLTGSQEMTGVFDGHRRSIQGAVRDSVDDVERMRVEERNRFTGRSQEQENDTIRRAARAWDSYPQTERGRVQAEAAADVAHATGDDIRAKRPEGLSAIDEVTEGLPEDFRDQGRRALDGFDQSLPQLLAQIQDNGVQTAAALGAQGAEAHTALNQAAAQMHIEFAAAEAQAIARVEVARPGAMRQIDGALYGVRRGIDDGVAAAIDAVTGRAAEASDLLAEVSAPEQESSDAYVDQVADMLSGMADDAGDELDSTVAGIGGQFQGVAAAAAQALAAQQREATQSASAAAEATGPRIDAFVRSVDDAFVARKTALDTQLTDGKNDIAGQLAPALSKLNADFAKTRGDTRRSMRDKVNEGLSKNDEALGELDGQMSEAASDAGWDYDHPVLSTIRDVAEFVAGLIVGILALVVMVVAVILLAEFLIAGLVALGLSAAVAGWVVLVAGLLVAGYFLYEGVKAHMAEGEGGWHALGNALLDMVGINEMRSAFSGKKSPFERGFAFGHGLATLVATVLPIAKGMRGRMTGRFGARAPALKVPASLEAVGEASGPARGAIPREPLRLGGPEPSPALRAPPVEPAAGVSAGAEPPVSAPAGQAAAPAAPAVEPPSLGGPRPTAEAPRPAQPAAGSARAAPPSVEAPRPASTAAEPPAPATPSPEPSRPGATGPESAARGEAPRPATTTAEPPAPATPSPEPAQSGAAGPEPAGQGPAAESPRLRALRGGRQGSGVPRGELRAVTDEGVRGRGPEPPTPQTPAPEPAQAGPEPGAPASRARPGEPPRLRALRGGGEGSGTPRGQLRSLPESGLPPEPPTPEPQAAEQPVPIEIKEAAGAEGMAPRQQGPSLQSLEGGAERGAPGGNQPPRASTGSGSGARGGGGGGTRAPESGGSTGPSAEPAQTRAPSRGSRPARGGRASTSEGGAPRRGTARASEPTEGTGKPPTARPGQRVTDPRVTEELPEGQSRTSAENERARQYYRNHRKAARARWEERTGQKWPEDPSTGRPARGEHTRPLGDGGHPLEIEPGYGDPNAPHMERGDPQRFGSRGGRPRGSKGGRLTDPRVIDELPEGQSRTSAENERARQYYRNHRKAARARWEERTGQKWPEDPSTGRPARGEHTRPLGDGGHPLEIEPGYGDPNAPHIERGDPQRFGRGGGGARHKGRPAQTRPTVEPAVESEPSVEQGPTVEEPELDEGDHQREVPRDSDQDDE